MKRLSKSTKMRGAIFALLLTFAMSVAAQVQVQGTVVDERGEPVIGATVRVQGTTQGTTADFNGSFTISAPADGTLVISFMGYTTQTVPVSANMNVRLLPDRELLDEVIVVGFGSGRSPAATAASVTRVSGAQLQNRPVANAMEALQGQVPGLEVFTSSGEPSAMSTMRLFGAGSLNASTAPLFVVDGMPVEANTLRSLNPLDFESVTVLRDASATSIYGARAANGVIFITTRRGVIGERGTVRVSGHMGFSQLANKNLFRSVMTADQLADFWIRSGIRSEESVNAQRLQFPGDTRWYQVYFRDRAPTNALDVSISGGGGRTNYFISAGRTHQQGVAVDRSTFTRMSFRSNVNTQVNDWLRTGINISISYDDLQANGLTGANLNFGIAYLHNPFMSPVDRYGNRYNLIPGLGTAGLFHPEYLNEGIRPFQESTFLNTTAFVEIRPIEGLMLRSQVGIEGMDQRRGTTVMPSSAVAPATGGTTQRFATRRQNLTATNTAEYRFTMNNDHTLIFLAGTEFVSHRFNEFMAQSAGLTDDRLLLLGAGPLSRNVGEDLREHAFLSFFGRAEYDFQERYFFNASLRNDASSRFGVDNRNALFWSVGTMWHLHREDFMQGVSWLNELTARLSVGTSGNADFFPNDLWMREYGHLPLSGVTQVHEGETSWFLNTPGNPALSWEHQTLYTLGFNASMFNGRLRGNVELYNRITSSMLLNVPHPATAGFATITRNIGRLGNRGVSFRIDGDVWSANRGQSFFTPYIVFSYNQERILELFDDRPYWLPGITGWEVGNRRTHTVPFWAGVNPQTGAPQWYLPYEGEGAVMRARRDPNYVTSSWNEAALRQNTGLPIDAPINGGWGFSVGHRGFHLQTDFTFSIGRYLFLNDMFFFANPTLNLNRNSHYMVNDFWTPDNRYARFPDPSQGFQFTNFDSRVIENASFMRLRNVTLGYVFPRSMLDRAADGFLTDARVFVTGRNLLTWTNFSGQDPEVDNNITMGINPNTRQFSVGFDLSF